MQRPPRDRVGWVHVRQVWLPGWRPAQWAYEVQHLEVTLESFWTAQRDAEAGLDVEPWDELMLTAYTTFLTDDLKEVEDFFAPFIDRPEFARHPDRVDCPHEYANEEWSGETPARYSLTRRAWAAFLLCTQERKLDLHWTEGPQALAGRVLRVGLGDFDLLTAQGLHTMTFGQRYGAQVWAEAAEGYAEGWTEPGSRIALDPSALPLWSFAQAAWIWSSEDGC
ncbi:hypothetical protein [Deinococcus multiflagellatus]|uniref:Uncharacterized protein n=1 Tax=Deinococcus multiflagellatus TaxID=1656887 RepID=A0ABW1ZLC1_9DEIO